jgi:hypothetical protein
MANLLEERRLIMRVYDAWQGLAANGLPRSAALDSIRDSAGWDQCLILALDPLFSRSRFSHVGCALRAAAGFDGASLADCAPGSLLDLVTRRVPQILQRKTPLGFGGSLQREDGDLLYRTVLLPLSEDGTRVDSVLGAIAFRTVPVEPEAPISDIAWVNRALSVRIDSE